VSENYAHLTHVFLLSVVTFQPIDAAIVKDNHEWLLWPYTVREQELTNIFQNNKHSTKNHQDCVALGGLNEHDSDIT
jgi:hypothetical protein